MAKKKYVVTKATKNENFNGIAVDGKKHMFMPGQQSFILDDSGKAAEVDKTYGLGKGASREVTVSEVDNLKTEDERNHKYHFSLRHLGNWKDRIDWGRDDNKSNEDDK